MIKSLKKICIVCDEEKEIKKFDIGFCGNRRNICEQCRNLRKRAALWICFLRAFQYKCQCCGETDIRFLTVDHINNDGNEDRLSRKSSDNIPILREAKESGFDKTKYTCLCYNCNCGKQRNKGICPHKGVDKEEYKQVYLKTGQIKFSKQIYVGDIQERNTQAQQIFKVNEFIKKASKEQIEEFINKLQNI